MTPFRNGFSNRHAQNNYHNGHFPQFPMTNPQIGHFGNWNTQQPRQNMPPMMMPRQQMPNMPQREAPRHPNTATSQMPPMHLLNPTNDPNVRFEPIPNGLGAAPAQAAPTSEQAPPTNGTGDLMAKLSDLVQGESNSIVFYENLAKSLEASETDKELLGELIKDKQQRLQNIAELYKNLAQREWAEKNVQIENISSLRSGLSYALRQESRLLRETTHIYENLDSVAHQRVVNAMLYHKMADIAHLMAI